MQSGLIMGDTRYKPHQRYARSYNPIIRGVRLTLLAETLSYSVNSKIIWRRVKSGLLDVRLCELCASKHAFLDARTAGRVLAMTESVKLRSAIGRFSSD